VVDGHIVLDRGLASRGHLPAIDILASVSRLMPDVVEKQHLDRSYQFRRLLADYNRIEDLVNLGAYERGNNQCTDCALEMIDDLQAFLRQDMTTSSAMASGLEELGNLMRDKRLNPL
jgi:flagellum-specific ATP synthase